MIRLAIVIISIMTGSSLQNQGQDPFLEIHTPDISVDQYKSKKGQITRIRRHLDSTISDMLISGIG